MVDFVILQHVSFEDPGHILTWVVNQGYTYTCVRPDLGEQFPEPQSFRFLCVMGGPMGIHDDHEFAWLADERSFIKQCIDSGKPILGVCLGSQFLADALGGVVTKNHTTEIGWMPIEKAQTLSNDLQTSTDDVLTSSNDALTSTNDTLTPNSDVLTQTSDVLTPTDNSFDKILPTKFTVFHWHGDTFSLPPNTKHLYKSKYCENQAFISNNNKFFRTAISFGNDQ
jgi:GMP synthase-like glutamine amidotransferase